MSAQELLADIHSLEEELLSFERKYGVRSEIFFAAYAQGEEPENEASILDFTEWASVYRTWLARQAEYRNEISRLQAKRPSLAGQQFSLWSFCSQGGVASNWRWVAGRCRWPGE
jgi:hypothetical protein